MAILNRLFAYLATILLILLVCVIKCDALDQKIGPWENIYKNNPDLAGVSVSQYPENIDPKEEYSGRHPAQIIYYFWNGSVRQIDYEPNGKIHDSFWFEKRLRPKPTDSTWEMVDFSYGSDPTFKRHPQFRWLLSKKQ